MAHRLGHAIASNQISNAVFFGGIGRVRRVVHDFGNPLAQLPDALHLFGILGIEMAIENPFLRMPNTAILSDGNDFVDLIHVHVPTGAVVRLQQGRNGRIPSPQHAFFSRIGRIKCNAGFGPADLRATDREFDLHGLGEALHFSAVQPRVHARATARCAATQ